MAGYNFPISFFLDLLEPLFPYTFDPLLTPLLAMGSPHTGALLAIAVVSVGLSAALMGLKYLLMDLEKHREFQERRKEINEKMKAAQNDGEVDKANEHMQEMLKMQKEFFQLQMKPMLVSMLVFFLVLPWMYTTFMPVVSLSASGGAYSGELAYNGVSVPMTVENNSEPRVVVDGETYTEGDRFMMDDLPWKVKQIDISDESADVKLAAEVIQLPVSLPGVGDELGWLGTYILFVLPASIVFGKLLGIQ